MKKDKNISGFKTPENYFENFEKQLFSKIEEVNLPKSAGFKVPTGYFESLEEKVLLNAIPSEKSRKVISLFSNRKLGYVAAIAACLVLCFMLFKPNHSISEDFNSLQMATIENYINDGNLNLDIYDVTTIFNDEDISAVNFENLKFSDGALKNYLMENIDEETLLNEEQ